MELSAMTPNRVGKCGYWLRVQILLLAAFGLPGFAQSSNQSITTGAKSETKAISPSGQGPKSAMKQDSRIPISDAGVASKTVLQTAPKGHTEMVIPRTDPPKSPRGSGTPCSKKTTIPGADPCKKVVQPKP